MKIVGKQEHQKNQADKYEKQLRSEYKQKMRQELSSSDLRIWENGKSSLELLKCKLKDPAFDSVVVELALMLDTKYDKCQDTINLLQK